MPHACCPAPQLEADQAKSTSKRLELKVLANPDAAELQQKLLRYKSKVRARMQAGTHAGRARMQSGHACKQASCVHEAAARLP